MWAHRHRCFFLSCSQAHVSYIAWELKEFLFRRDFPWWCMRLGIKQIMFKATLNCTWVKEINPFPSAVTTSDENNICGRSAAIIFSFLSSSKSTASCQLFSRSLRETQIFSLKSSHGPELVFYMIWDIFHQPIDVVQPIWEARPALCLSATPASSSFLYVSRE